jgi:exopolysaccharide biosynthesis protein
MKNYSLLLLFCVWISACQSTKPFPQFSVKWAAVDSLNQKLPSDIQVFQSQMPEIPLKAWLIRIQNPAKLKVLLSDDADGKESVADFGKSACVAVNGGYFNMRANPAFHVGLVISEGKMLSPPSPEAPRSAFCIASGKAKIVAESEAQSCQEALGAGPSIMQNGIIQPQIEAEGFSTTSIPAQHPRTAVGITQKNEVLFLIVDGRQPESAGVLLWQEAAMLRDLGATNALNLDGGGSSSAVVLGNLLNKPVGNTFLREIVSAIVVFC